MTDLILAACRACPALEGQSEAVRAVVEKAACLDLAGTVEADHVADAVAAWLARELPLILTAARVGADR